MPKVIDEMVLAEWRKLPPERQEAEFLKAQDEIGALRLEVARLKEEESRLNDLLAEAWEQFDLARTESDE